MLLVIYYSIHTICKKDKTALSSLNRDHLKITKWIFSFLIFVEYCNNRSLQSIHQKTLSKYTNRIQKNKKQMLILLTKFQVKFSGLREIIQKN